jgi:hypothetical protein
VADMSLEQLGAIVAAARARPADRPNQRQPLCDQRAGFNNMLANRLRVLIDGRIIYSLPSPGNGTNSSTRPGAGRS